MIQIIWEFRVKPGHEPEFERHYSAEGTWASFFRKSSAYRGTTLLRNAQDAMVYLTIDRWDDESSYSRFRDEFAAEYQALDQRFGAFTESERQIGIFVLAGR